MEQTADLKKISLLFVKKIKNIVAFAALGALLFAVIYLAQRAIFSEGQFYRVSSDYYITFNLEKYPNGVDYYNAYTWDTILRDDPIVDVVMDNLPDTYTKDEVKSAISGEMLGDYRILTAYVTTREPEKAQEIAAALKQSLTTFPRRMDIISKIEMWSEEPCKPLKEENRVWNAALLGAVLGLVAGCFYFAFACVLDDGVYVEDDYDRMFGAYKACAASGKKRGVESDRVLLNSDNGKVPFLGMMTKKKSESCIRELQSNMALFLEKNHRYCLAHVSKSPILPGNVYQDLKEIYDGVADCLSMHGEELEQLKNADGIILMAPWGSKNGRMLRKTICFLEKQGCHPAGVIFYGAEDKFLQSYYGKAT